MVMLLTLRALDKENGYMKVLRTSMSVLMVLFLMVSLGYGESTIEDATKQKVETPIHSFNGVEYLKKGMLNEAIAEFDKAIEIDSRDANAYYNRGLAYFYKGQYDQSISDF